MTTDLIEQFETSAALLPHILNVTTDQVILSRLTEADYRNASFLDQRIITPQLQRQAVQWKALSSSVIPHTSEPHYIFHIGHVGSTLLSRLLGENPEILALREPHILRSIAEISQIRHEPHSPWSPQQYEDRLIEVTTWLSRTFRPKQRAMIKASSFVSEISGDLLKAGGKAMLLYTSLPRYLETIMAGPASRQEAEQLAGTRLIRLHKRLGTHIANLWELSHVQRASLGWLCEMSTLMTMSKTSNPASIRWQNFDTFLGNPAEELLAVAQFYDLGITSETVMSWLSGPIMKTYSKAPEHDYSPDLRRQLLDQARREFRAEMEKATEWIIDLSKKYALIDEIMSFSSGTNHV